MNNNINKLPNPPKEIDFTSDKEMMEYIKSWEGDEIVDYQKENPENW